MSTLQSNRLPVLGQLETLDRALKTPGVTITKLRLVRRVQEEVVNLTHLKDRDLENLLDCSERTAWEARRWVSQFFATMHVCSTQEDLVPGVQNNIHGEEDPAARLAKAQLQALNWGMLEGRQVQDLDTFIDQQGALNVLYAIWCSQGKRIQNPPAFVTWWLRQGHQAPPDWLPAELRVQEERPQQAEDSCRKEVPKVTKGASGTFGTASPQKYLEEEGPAADIEPLRASLLAYIKPRVRPASFHAWFEPLAVVEAQESLCLQASTTAHADWVQECYHRLLTNACLALGYSGYRLKVDPDREDG